MNTGQMLLTIGALVLFSLLAVQANKTVLQSKKTSMESEFGLTAVQLAQNLIDQARGEAFDAATVGGDTVTVRNSLTAANGLGPSAVERMTWADTVNPATGQFLSATRFNDLDDFNWYIRQVNTPRASYTLRARVWYVSETNPTDTVMTTTFLKRIGVTASCPNIPAPIPMDYVVGY
jgi:hypothetical protein